MTGGGECDGFALRVERHFGALLAEHGFALAGRAAAGGGRHLACQAVYRSARCQVLFELEDGAHGCALAAAGTPPPPVEVLRYATGADGWYALEELVEFSTGRRLLTPRVTDELRDGRRDQLAWLAGVLGPRAEALFGLFTPGLPAAWHDDFMRFQRTKRPYGHESVRERVRRWLS